MTSNAGQFDGMTKEEIFKANINLVYRIAHRFMGRNGNMAKVNGYDFEDVVQLGFLGLWKCVNAYDPTRGLKFSSLACPYIEGTIMSATRASFKVRVPRPVVNTYWKIVRNGLQGSTPSQVADALGVSLELAKEALMFNPTLSSLQGAANNADDSDGDMCFENMLGEASFEETLTGNLTVQEFLKTLTDRERQVWNLLATEGLNQREIGRLIGRSPASVSRTVKQVYAKAAEYGKAMRLLDRVATKEEK